MSSKIRRSARAMPNPIKSLGRAAYRPFNPTVRRPRNPPRHAIRLRAAAERVGGDYLIARPEYRAQWPDLTYWDGADPEYFRKPRELMLEEAVGFVGAGRLLGRHGWPVTPDDAIIIDAISMGILRSDRHFERPMRVVRARHLRGRTLNITVPSGDSNYGHALLDSVGRLAVLHRAGVKLDQFDHMVIPATKSRNIAQVLDLAGVPLDKRVPAPAGSHFVCDDLVVATAPGRTPTYSPTLPEYLRGLGIAGTTGRKRRLLVMREGEARRPVANPEGIAALARDYDLEIYDPREHGFTPADFVEAELVVGQHGAALTDIAFAPPGLKVVEVLPDGNPVPFFGSLASSAGHHYTMARGRSIGEGLHAPVEVDWADLRRAIDTVLTRG